MDSALVLQALLNHTNIHILLFQTNTLNVDREIKETIKIINYLAENKKEIFKEKIRLFAPSSKILKDNKEVTHLDEIDIKKKIEEFEKICDKVNKKLSKLLTMDLSYNYHDTDDLIETKKLLISLDKNIEIFLKDYNQLYATNIKYISEEKTSNLHLSVETFLEKYDKVIELSNYLQEIFALQKSITDEQL